MEDISCGVLPMLLVRAVSSLPDQISKTHFQSGCDPGQRIHRDRLFHTLDLADVFGVQIGQFAKPLLGEFCLMAIPTDGLRKGFAM
jgi:hypothetical protein